MSFPRDAISVPTVIEVHRWKATACSPQLQEHEAVVSNVIEISTSNDEALKFNAEVKLTFSHSAARLHGYELVLFKLSNKETNEWEDVGVTENFQSLSGKRLSFYFFTCLYPRCNMWRLVGRMINSLDLGFGGREFLHC